MFFSQPIFIQFARSSRLAQLLPSSDCLLCCESVDLADALIGKSAAQSPIICNQCHSRLPQLKTGCPICAMPMPAATNSVINPLACGACLQKAPYFQQTVAAFHYEPPISDFIAGLKYRGQLNLLTLLCDYLKESIERHYQLFDPLIKTCSNQSANQTAKQATCQPLKLPEVIIPVPLHPKKTRSRGFNQSLLIAKRLSKKLQLPIDNQLIKRRRYTRAQSSLDATQRQKNLKGAFTVGASHYNHVAVVDDVMTTGSTANEISLELIKSGVEQVDIWCIARAFKI